MPLRDLIANASPTAVLTFSTGAQMLAAKQDEVFLPIHGAIVLASNSAWDVAALERALNAALLPELSVSGSSLSWEQMSDVDHGVRLSGPQHLVFSVEGDILVLASDDVTLQSLVAAHGHAPQTSRKASMIAGFNHTAEQAPYMRLTELLDHNTTAASSEEGVAPPFFSGNLASLSDIFRDLDTETFTQSTGVDHTIHQTVLYHRKH